MQVPIRNLLVIKLGALGDVIQAMGAIADIRVHYADARITVLTTPPFKKIFERCPAVNRVRIDPRDPRFRLDKMLKLRKRLREDAYDMIFDLQKVSRTAFYYRWFFNGTRFSGKARGCSHPIASSNKLPRLQELAHQLEIAGVALWHTLKPDISWMVDDTGQLALESGIRGRYILLMPGCSAGRDNKRWPYFPQLAEKLIRKGFAVATAPGPDDDAVCRQVPGIMLAGPGRYLDHFGLAGVIKGCSLFIGNDSGPSHMAAHLNVPGLVLFGPHICPVLTDIRHNRLDYIQSSDLRTLTVDQVMAEIDRRWGNLT